MSRPLVALCLALVAGVSLIVGYVAGGGGHVPPPKTEPLGPHVAAARRAGPTPPPGAPAGSLSAPTDQPGVDPEFEAALAPAARLELASASQPAGPLFADIVGRINPSVVHIEVLDPDVDPHDDPQESQTPPGTPQRGEGSGFVVDARGYILTNHHVVAGADRIRVHLADKRDIPAALVGSDAATDVALVRIAAPPGLRAVPLGDSDRLRVGDWVCAIGNPLGFDHSATVGVVSSKGRKIWDLSFDAYIQTDAAINPGNSGGPLLNTAGEAVGINAAVSREGQGIGFAIPINLVREVLVQLRRHGKVTRGYLGVQLDELDLDTQRLLGLREARGALVVDVAEGAGRAAGLRRYDVITAVDGRAVQSGDELVRSIALTAPGTEVALAVVRDGRELMVRARLDERRIEPAEQASPSPRPPAGRGDRLGLRVAELRPEQRRSLRLPAERQGVVIEEVLGWSAEADELAPGDLVVEVDRTPVPDLASYRRRLAALASGTKALLFVYRPGSADSFFAKLEVEAP